MDLLAVVLTISSVLISPVISGACGTHKLFLMWAFVCLGFVTYFSGSLTSVMIRPPPDDRFTRIEQLLENNYFLTFDYLPIKELAAELITQEFAVATRNSPTERRLNMLAGMISSSTIYAEMQLEFTFTKLPKEAVPRKPRQFSDTKFRKIFV